MKPIVKVWPLPKLSEAKLKVLALTIVEACKAFPNLKVQGEDDVLIQFPQDMMRYGAGTELVVEILFVSNVPTTVDAFRDFDTPAVEIAFQIYKHVTGLGFTPKTRVVWSLVRSRNL